MNLVGKMFCLNHNKNCKSISLFSHISASEIVYNLIFIQLQDILHSFKITKIYLDSTKLFSNNNYTNLSSF